MMTYEKKIAFFTTLLALIVCMIGQFAFNDIGVSIFALVLFLISVNSGMALKDNEFRRKLDDGEIKYTQKKGGN